MTVFTISKFVIGPMAASAAVTNPKLTAMVVRTEKRDIEGEPGWQWQVLKRVVTVC